MATLDTAQLTEKLNDVSRQLAEFVKNQLSGELVFKSVDARATPESSPDHVAFDMAAIVVQINLKF